MTEQIPSCATHNHAQGNVYHQGENTSGGNKTNILEVYNAARPYVILYENNGERFRTTSSGGTVSGTLIVNNDLGVGATPGSNLAGRAHCIALGDSDTGVAQNGDGQFEIWSNNQEICNFDTGEIHAYKPLRVDNHFRVGTTSSSQDLTTTLVVSTLKRPATARACLPQGQTIPLVISTEITMAGLFLPAGGSEKGQVTMANNSVSYDQF